MQIEEREELLSDAQGLGAAFQEVAAIRYEWFEVMFRTDPLNLRRDFKAGFGITMRVLYHLLMFAHAGWIIHTVKKILKDGRLEAPLAQYQYFNQRIGRTVVFIDVWYCVQYETTGAW